MNNTLDHKCPNCNAILKYNPHGNNWKCEYCRSEFNLEQITEYESKAGKELNEDTGVNSNIDMYTCSNCGAKIIADNNTSATSCIYCKNTAILKDKLVGDFNPKYVIPFKNTKEDAINAFKSIGKGKLLAPKEFTNKKNINEMSGIYIPFWLYDCDATGMVEANCNRITSWVSGNYRYTKTDTYLVTRGGSMTFEKIPVDGSKRFENDIMNSIEPFNYTEMKDFNYSYLSGFLAEKYDVTSEEAKEDYIKRTKNSFIDEMKKDISGYATVVPVKNSIELSNEKNDYVLLPVWMLNIKYKDKIYTFAMNGQTGKMVGNIPIDKKKAVIAWIIIFTITFVCMFLFSYFKVIK